MAISQTGSTLTFPITSNANTGTVSSTVTVPVDAELVVVGMSGYQGTLEGHEAMSFTKGGVDSPMVKIQAFDTDQATYWQGAVFYQVLPDALGTATSSLKWDWVGSGTSLTSDQLFSVTFWKGVDTSSPMRDFDGIQTNSFPMTTPTVSAQSGDVLLVWLGGYAAGSEGSVNSWTNATTLNNLTHNGDSDGAWATGSPSADTSVTAATVTSFSEGSLIAMVLQPPITGLAMAGATINWRRTDAANTGTVSTAIYVPATTDIAIVGVSLFQGTAAGIDSMTLTKGGVDTAMTKVTGGDAGTGVWQAAMFYMISPDTGTNKTLKWDWIGSGTSGDATILFSISFWAGADVAGGVVRSSAGTQGSGFPLTTSSLTCVSGDKIVAWYGGYTGGSEGSIDTWTNLSTLRNEQHNTHSDGAWATGSPSGNTTVSAASATNFSQGGLLAVVLKAQATGYTLAADAGSYAIAGTDATLTKYTPGKSLTPINPTAFRPFLVR